MGKIGGVHFIKQCGGKESVQHLSFPISREVEAGGGAGGGGGGGGGGGESSHFAHYWKGGFMGLLLCRRIWCTQVVLV